MPVSWDIAYFKKYKLFKMISILIIFLTILNLISTPPIAFVFTYCERLYFLITRQFLNVWLLLHTPYFSTHQFPCIQLFTTLNNYKEYYKKKCHKLFPRNTIPCYRTTLWTNTCKHSDTQASTPIETVNAKATHRKYQRHPIQTIPWQQCT